jgi:hypothetical protein
VPNAGTLRWCDHMTGSAIEITQEEFDTRKLTKYGRISTLIDAVSVALILAIMSGIVTTMIPGAASPDEYRFWLAFEVLLAIMLSKKLERIWHPLDFYQTLIIRK